MSTSRPTEICRCWIVFAAFACDARFGLCKQRGVTQKACKKPVDTLPGSGMILLLKLILNINKQVPTRPVDGGRPHRFDR